MLADTGEVATILAAIGSLVVAAVAVGLTVWQMKREQHRNLRRALDETRRLILMCRNIAPTWRGPGHYELVASIGNALLFQLTDVIDITPEDQDIIEAWVDSGVAPTAETLRALDRASHAITEKLGEPTRKSYQPVQPPPPRRLRN